MPLLATPGEAIVNAMERHGMTQVELSRIMDIYQSEISRIISGQRNITPEMAVRLDAALGVSASYILKLQRDKDLIKARRAMKDKSGEIRRRLEAFNEHKQSCKA